MGDAGSPEDRLIAHYFKPLAKHPAAFGLQDDAAAITPPAGHDLVLKTDGLIAGVHFFPDDPADDVGRKALRVNLSDLAAKGATPLGFLLAIALPKGFSEDWLAAFARGLGEDADRYQCPLLGGDTDSTPGPISISISAFGTLPQGTMPRRSGARAGDHVFVTGTIGDAALGLRLRQDAGAGKAWKLDAAMSDYLVGRYRVPQPRNALADDGACACIGRDGRLGRARRRPREALPAPRTCRPTSPSRACRCRRPPRTRSPADADADRADPHRRRGLRDPLRGFAAGRVSCRRAGRGRGGDRNRPHRRRRPPAALSRPGRAGARLFAPRLQPFLSIRKLARCPQ